MWGTVPPESASTTILGVDDWAGFGDDPLPVGDVDGDGLDDLVLSDTTLDPDEVNLYLLPGSLVGLAVASELAHGTLALVGGEAVHNGPFAVGDLDEDGLTDLAVGSDDVVGSTTFIFSAGIVGGGILGDFVATIWLDSDGRWIAETIVAGAGDMTGDGRQDLAIADRLVDEGVVYLFAGPLEGAYGELDAHAIVRGTDPDRKLGYSLGHADTTGDGVADLLVTASSYADGYVVHGPLTGDLEVDLVFDAHITVPVNEFLVGLDHGGDLDGDGAPELLAQPRWVLPDDLSGEVDATMVAVGLVDATEDYLYVDSLKPAGDVDGDGFDDLLATTSGHFAMTDDRAHLLYGPIEGVVCTGATGVTFDIDADPWSISGAGDTNGDGYDDVVIGSVWADGLVPHAGAAYVFLGGP